MYAGIISIARPMQYVIRFVYLVPYSTISLTVIQATNSIKPVEEPNKNFLDHGKLVYVGSSRDVSKTIAPYRDFIHV